MKAFTLSVMAAVCLAVMTFTPPADAGSLKTAAHYQAVASMAWATALQPPPLPPGPPPGPEPEPNLPAPPAPNIVPAPYFPAPAPVLPPHAPYFPAPAVQYHPYIQPYYQPFQPLLRWYQPPPCPFGGCPF